MKSLNWLIFITFLIRFSMENFLSLFMSMTIEIKQFNNRNLSDGYPEMMSFGILFNFIYLVFWGSLLTYFTFWFPYISPKGILGFMKIDLNTKYWIFSLLYFIDFFAFRIIIVLLFGLSGIVKSIALWFIILFFYFVSFFINIVRIYQSKLD